MGGRHPDAHVPPRPSWGGRRRSGLQRYVPTEAAVRKVEKRLNEMPDWSVVLTNRGEFTKTPVGWVSGGWGRFTEGGKPITRSLAVVTRSSWTLARFGVPAFDRKARSGRVRVPS